MHFIPLPYWISGAVVSGAVFFLRRTAHCEEGEASLAESWRNSLTSLTASGRS